MLLTDTDKEAEGGKVEWKMYPGCLEQCTSLVETHTKKHTQTQRKLQTTGQEK